MSVKDEAIKVAKRAYHAVREPWLDAVARHYLRRIQRKEKNHDVIRVGFIVQMPEVWDKEVDVYEEMLRREDFDPILLVVPPYDFVTDCVGTDYTGNYFLERYPDAICAVLPDGITIDVSALDLDYVFYQRPYDSYLPESLRSSSLVKITRCCEIPYAYMYGEDELGVCKNKDFGRNMYFQFESSQFTKDYLCRVFRRSCDEGLKHVEYLGYPVLDQYLHLGGHRGGIQSVLWTPRWSYDPRIGGSHFFEYKNTILLLAREHPQMNFIFRPHPLMFEEFIKKGLMTEAGKDNFLTQLEELNITYDNESTIENAISSADILITDTSSIMIQYFLTGRPMIYCKSGRPFIGFFSEMEGCVYSIDNEDELLAAFSEVASGTDSLAEKRRELINKEFDVSGDSAARIVDRIKDDYRKC